MPPRFGGIPNDDPARPTLAPATVWDIYVVFRKIILAATRRGFLTRSPIPEDIAEILPKKRRQKVLRFLTEAEVARLARAFNTPWDILVYTGAYGGLRLGELAALRVEDFDFHRGTVYVDESVTDVEGILDYGDPKSETSIRNVSLPDEVMVMVRHHIDTCVGWDDRRPSSSRAQGASPSARTIGAAGYGRKPSRLPASRHSLRTTSGTRQRPSGSPMVPTSSKSPSASGTPPFRR